MPIDAASANATSETVNKDREEKGYTKLKANTSILDDLMTRKDCETCHQELNKALTLLESKLDQAITTLTTQIAADFTTIKTAITAGALVAVPMDGGKTALTAIGTVIAGTGAEVFTPRNEQVTTLPQTLEKEKLKKKAKAKAETDKAPLSAGEQLTGGKTA